MKTYSLLLFVAIFCNIACFDGPSSKPLSNELECINYFLSNLTNFSRQNHFVLLITNASEQSMLETKFLETQILNRVILLKNVQREVKKNFDRKSSYIIFLSTFEIEQLDNLLSKAKGTLHIVIEKNHFIIEDQFMETILQIINRAKNISSGLSIFFHVNFNKTWKLFRILRNQDTAKFELLATAECFVNETELKSKNSNAAQFLRVKSPNASPYSTCSKQGQYCKGIDLNLLRLISEKLKMKIEFELLNVTAYNNDTFVALVPIQII